MSRRNRDAPGMTPSDAEAQREKQRAVADISRGGASPPFSMGEEDIHESHPDFDTMSSEHTDDELPRVTPGTADELLCTGGRGARLLCDWGGGENILMFVMF
ncbi:hypothetical protein NDU88_001620 [Pleurodeles waltl]|uniref:Uncharacterized protein n=1 Tax=Pleurodeles waltl TaxID=8319 RepID=A0AAV7R939_PLEWA|nr:hypothetical protein NDU88_001620 [Pleurodeles waltl]